MPTSGIAGVEYNGWTEWARGAVLGSDYDREPAIPPVFLPLLNSIADGHPARSDLYRQVIRPALTFTNRVHTESVSSVDRLPGSCQRREM